MKKLFLIVLAMAVVAGASVLSVNHYQNYQNKKLQQEVADNQARIDVLNEARNKIIRLESDNQELLAECQKGMVAYGQLSTSVKSKTPQPLCTTTDPQAR